MKIDIADVFRRCVEVCADHEKIILAPTVYETRAIINYTRALEHAVKIMAAEIGSEFYQREAENLLALGADTERPDTDDTEALPEELT